MRRTSLTAVILILLTTVSICIAVDPRQMLERERQRRESMGNSQNSAAQSSPQTVSIERLKLQSDTPVEYQFEPVPTLIIQGEKNSLVNEDITEKQVETASEVQPQEQPAEEVAAAEPSPEETADGENTPVQAEKGQPSYRIIEEDSRIVVLQVEKTPAHSKPTQ